MAQNNLNFPSRSRTQALGKLYKKITNEDMPAGANTTTEALQKVYEALTEDTKHHTNVTKIIDDLATNWSGGGGGSSDFSTAEVTFASVIDKYEATVIGVHADCIKSKSYFVIPGAPVTVTVPLYKGKNLLPLAGLGMVDESYLPTTEGSIVLDLDAFSFVVTGNGTITAKGVHRD